MWTNAFFFYLSSADINKIPIITNLGTTSLTRTFDENSGVGTPVYDVDFTDANSGETHTFSATFSPTSCEDMYTIDSNSKCYTVKHCFLPWSWSYGSWIYNYDCNHCLLPLMLWVWIQLMRGVLDTTICDKVCQWLAAGRLFSPGNPVSSTNKTDRHDINEILLKVA